MLFVTVQCISLSGRYENESRQPAYHSFIKLMPSHKLSSRAMIFASYFMFILKRLCVGQFLLAHDCQTVYFCHIFLFQWWFIIIIMIIYTYLLLVEFVFVKGCNEIKRNMTFSLPPLPPSSLPLSPLPPHYALSNPPPNNNPNNNNKHLGWKTLPHHYPPQSDNPWSTFQAVCSNGKLLLLINKHTVSIYLLWFPLCEYFDDRDG